MNIFVYRPGAIGDTMLTLPALHALRHRFPGCVITYAGNNACRPLLPVDDAISADDTRLLPLFADPPVLWQAFDFHVFFCREPIALEPFIHCDPLSALAQQRNVADVLVDAIDASFEPRIPALSLPRLLPQASSRAAPGLAIHPGAGAARKRWPAASFAAVANQLGLPVAVLGGPADGDCPEQVARLLGVECTLWRDLPLPELASKLASVELFLGNDSGITHLAAACGVPAVALYIATDPAVWGIRGARTRCLRGSSATVDSVVRTARSLLES